MSHGLWLHERWFLDDRLYPVQFEQAVSPVTWFALGIALATTIVAVLVRRMIGRRSLIPGPTALGMTWENYERLLSWMPLVIGLHAGVTLLVSGVNARLFVPNLQLPWHIVGGLLGLAQIGVGLSFMYGALTRVGAVVLALTWLGGAFLFGPLRLTEHVFLLGIAFFLFASGRGPLSLDMAMEKLHKPYERLTPYAVPVLRTLTGLSIVVLAFTEKLWNVPMGVAFLADHQFNFFPALGLDQIDDATFVVLMGTLELTLGMLLMSGVFVRLFILLAWVPFNLTLPFLGWSELLGHLPLYGIMGLLLIWGDDRPEKERAMVAGAEEHT